MLSAQHLGNEENTNLPPGAVAKIDELIFTRHFDTIVMSAMEKPMRKPKAAVFRAGFEWCAVSEARGHKLNNEGKTQILNSCSRSEQRPSPAPIPGGSHPTETASSRRVS